MTLGAEPRWEPLGAGRPSDAAGVPRRGGLAVVALVFAVVSLLIPVFPGIVALVLALMATRRARALPTGAAASRGLAAVAIAVSTIGVLAWVGVGVLVIAQRQEPSGWHAATAAAAARVDRFSQVTAPPTTEPATTEPATTEPATTEPATTEPRAAAGGLGDRVIVFDEFGDAQFEVTITKVKFSTGDEFERPEHGLFMGAYVRVRALADEQDTIDAAEMSALVGGHRYAGNAISFLRAFDPPLDYVLLDNGQRAAGWVVFDVPARHGRIILRDILDGHQLSVWKY